MENTSTETLQKTFSQKVARFFELMNYAFLFIETFVGAIVLLLSLISLLWLGWYGLLFAVLSLFCLCVFCISNVLLFIGYCLHSRGRLVEWKIKWLWIGTIVFNMIPLGFIVYWVREMPLFDLFSADFWADINNRIIVFILAWFIAVCGLSVVCLFDDYSLKNNGNAP